MTYTTEIITRIKNSDNWPAFDRPDFLNELNEVADAAFLKDSIEGYLASVLIYHQITEEMIKLLVECCDFLMQVAIFPMEIRFKRKDGRMFGQILNDLEDTISFEKKSDFVQNCRKINNIRIGIVHKLTTRTSVQEVKKQSSKIKEVFDEIFSLFEEIYDDFRASFHGYWKDVDWDDYIEE